MTQTNQRIGKIIRPDACWHESTNKNDSGGDCYSHCKHCGSDYNLINPDYLNPDGIQLIKEYLIQEGKWVEFKDYLSDEHSFDSMHSIILCMLELVEIATDPEQFCNLFLEYAEKELEG